METASGFKSLRYDGRPTTYTVNARYAAFAGHRGITVRDWSLPNEQTYSIRYETGRPRFNAVLAFSPVELNVLAVANGSQILIFDVAARKTRGTLKGNGRIVNSIEFAISEPNTLITGAVDGSFCVWSLDEPSRPLHHIRGLIGACSNVAVSPTNVNHLAVCHKGKVSIWSLPGLRPVAVMNSATPTLELLSWCPDVTNSIAGVSPNGTITLWNIRDVWSASKTSRHTDLPEDEEDDDHAMFGEPDDVDSAPCSTFELGYPVTQVHLLGRRGLAVLPRQGKTLFFYAYSQETSELTELWRLGLDATIECFTLRELGTGVKAAACFHGAAQDYNIPAQVLDGMGWSDRKSSIVQSPRMYDLGSPNAKASSRSSATMRPELPLRKERNRHRPTTVSPKPLPIDAVQREQHSYNPSRLISNPQRPRSEASPVRSMKSSLGLPKPKDSDSEEATMPFLSPTIPARQMVQDTLPPLDLHVHHTARASFDSMVSSTTLENDSDSDDETFAGNMRSSGLLPGGVNVPLPRTCGASFGPNGQLCTFFPFRVRPPSFMEEVEVMDSGKVGTHISDATRLFPTFGNLAATLRLEDNSGLNSVTDLTELASEAPQFIVQPASFESRPSWKAKFSPIKASSRPTEDERTVRVAVHELGSLLPARKSLAEQYRLISHIDESDTQLCDSNADVAAREGLCEVADAWHALGMMLEHAPAPDVDLTEDWSHGIGMVSQRPSLSRNISMVSERADGTTRSGMRPPQWRDHPLGQAWAVDKILGWAEGKADVQTLACTSALTSRAVRRRVADLLPRLSVVRPDVLTSKLLKLDTTQLRDGASAFHRQSSGLGMVEEDPPKSNMSRTSSRDPSQPPTPYLNSSTSTPPLSFSAANRQNARFFASGSASPEHHHRSSFGAAAKYYAQTISDKFSSYGSSPPTRKAGTSPGNELSSSLPTAAGSWSKSVSFVSNLAAARNDARSISLAQEDDNYDSDKTIDDASLPRTPKMPQSGVSYVTNGQDAFFDEFGTNFASTLFPAKMVGNSRQWCQSYSEQLRSWDLLVEAAELENMNDLDMAPDSASDAANASIFPEPVVGKNRAMCAICYCIIRGAEQLCPSCLHATHPGCLEQLVDDLRDEQFTCPTGCGCNCSSISELHLVVVEGVKTTVEPAHLPFKKKSSFTDPRRLRTKLQGESW